MKFIARLIYWPLRILWLLFCTCAGILAAFVIALMVWHGALWCWEKGGAHKWEIAVCASLVTCGGLIVASYEWAKRTLNKK